MNGTGTGCQTRREAEGMNRSSRVSECDETLWPWDGKQGCVWVQSVREREAYEYKDGRKEAESETQSQSIGSRGVHDLFTGGERAGLSCSGLGWEI